MAFPAMLRELQAQQQNADDLHLLTGVQRASFLNTDEEYLCIAIAKPALPTAHRNIGITLGCCWTSMLKAHWFWNDPAIPKATVNITCERCSITDCKERAAPPTVNHRKEERKKIQEALDRLTNRK